MTTTKLTPAEISVLSDAELNEYVAKLCGWTRCLDHPTGRDDFFPPGVDGTLSMAQHKAVPNYATSIDAQQAPGGPEEIGRGRGWALQVVVRGGKSLVMLFRDKADDADWFAELGHKPEARLRLEAWALALQEGTR